MDKNKADSLLEGSYTLLIRGNQMALIDDETGVPVSTRCHPDDEFNVYAGFECLINRIVCANTLDAMKMTNKGVVINV